MDEQKCYIELAAAVIRQAITDLKFLNSKNKKAATIGRDAYKFLSGERLDKWCSILGLSPNYISKQIGKFNDLFE